MQNKAFRSLWILVLAIIISVAYSCPSNCLFCLDQKICVTCQNSYFLTTTSSCIQRSVENCRVYFETGKCAVCEPSFKISNDACVKDFSGCLLRDKNEVCQQCGFGTTLNIKGECLGVTNCMIPQKQCKTCKNGYKLANNKCVYAGAECKTLQSNGLCSACKDGYILNGFECVSKGSNAVQNGNINMIEKCSLYSRNENDCLECEKGYTLFNNACKSNGQVYTKTLELANNKIRQASNQTYIDTPSEFIKYDKITYSIGGKKDDYLDPNQKQIDRVIFQGVGSKPEQADNCLIRAKDTLACQVCLDGYYFFNGLCKIKPPVCVSFNPRNNKCEKCHDNFVLTAGQCIDPNCETYLYSECSKCKNGFLLNEAGYCYDPYCITRKSGDCTKCNSGYELGANKLCYKAIEGCGTYNSQNTFCIECYKGYALAEGFCKKTEDERCLRYSTTNSQECVICRDRFALMQGACIDLYCKLFITPLTCSVCKQGYFMHQSLYCYDQNCVLYKNGTCINCANNYKLQDGFCVNVLIGCSQVNLSTQKCANCIEGYRVVDGKCIYSDKERCLKYYNGLCISCKIEYALVNGTCVDLLCERETLYNNFYACTQCKPGYNITSAGLCYDENCYQTANGSCTWCADSYIIGPYGLCVKNTLGCLNWNQTENRCLSCYQGYTLQKNGVCTIFTSQSSNTNPTNPTNPTTPINPTNPNTNPTSPTNPTTPTTPTTPVTPSVIDNTQILTPSQITPKPKPIDPNCKQYDSSNNCKSCEGRYFIRNSLCVLVPQICKGWDMKSGNCTSCADPSFAIYSQESNYNDCYKKIVQNDANCARKNNNLFCIKCKANYYIKAGFCYPADTLCKTFDTYGGECLTCYEGYTLEGEKCIPLTKQSKCKTYDFQNVCIQCDLRYYVDKAGVCKEISAFCLMYEMIGGNCLTCQLGYWPVNGICIKVKDPVPNCKVTNELGNCVQCINRYYVDAATLTCKLVNQLCNDYNKNTGACLNCSSGYKLRPDLGLCVIQSAQDLCSAFSDTGYCTKCASGYFLTTLQKCVKLNPLCSAYNQESGQCQKCIDNYYLTFKECVQKFKKDSLDTNCQLGDTFNFCIKCKTGYYINVGNCFKVSDQCKTFNANTGACETCYDGFVIQNRNCVSTLVPSTVVEDFCQLYSGTLCIKCKTGYYLSYDGPMPACAKANPLCKTYNDFNGDCYTCVDGYSLSNGKCNLTPTTPTVVPITPVTPSKSYVQVAQINCKEFDLTASVCVTCYTGFYYSKTDSKCIKPSSECRTVNSTNGWCTSCFEGYYLTNNVCLYGSASSSIKEAQDKLITIDAVSINRYYCQKFDQASKNCLTCFLGYQLANGACTYTGTSPIVDPYCTAVTEKKCVNCLPGYYVELKTGVCTLVSLWCETYAMTGGACSKCKVGSIMQDGTCIKPALGVDQYCSFYDGAYCKSCVAGYKLVSSMCQKA